MFFLVPSIELCVVVAFKNAIYRYIYIYIKQIPVYVIQQVCKYDSILWLCVKS